MATFILPNDYRVNELNTVVFMVHRPSPNNNNNIYHGEILAESFKKIVIDNIHKVIGRYEAPMPDIILTGDFNFPKASWNAGIGSVNPDGKYNDISLRQLINVASDQGCHFLPSKSLEGITFFWKEYFYYNQGVAWLIIVNV